MIKSKIEARERAVELITPIAIELIKSGSTVNLESMANEMVEYLIGDANLPDVEPSIEELTAKSIEKLISATNIQSLGTMGVIGSFDKNNKS